MSNIPRVSISKEQIKSQNLLLHSCALSKRIYIDPSNRYTTVHRNRDALFVCFKGCSSWRDYMKSIDIRSCKIHGEMLGIHNGFCADFKNIREALFARILNDCSKYGIKDVVFTGHSAGGSVAQICSLFLHDIIRDNSINKHCYTFGSPKAGDISFKEALEYLLNDNLLRVETYNDIVCLLPMQPAFKHAGNQLVMKGGDVFDKKEDASEFFRYYYNEYIDFITEFAKSGCFNKNGVDTMINDHSCDSYFNNLRRILKSN